MNSQSMQPNGEVIGVFDDRQSALKVQKAIASSGIPTQKVSIDTPPSSGGSAIAQASEKARGTTWGGEAGILIGGFYGGVIGIIVGVIVPFWVDGIGLNSASNRLLLLGLTLAGAVIGFIYGNQALAAQKKKQKENPSMLTAFRVVVNGSQDEIAQARRVLNETNA